jgi:type IV secretory pathway VirB10-like protein
MDLAYRSRSTDRRFGLLLTALVHVALIGGWQMTRTLPAPASSEEGARTRIFWIPLPQPKPQQPKEEEETPAPRKEAAAPRPYAGPALSLPAPPPVTPAPAPADSAAVTPAAPAATADAPAQAAAQKPSAEEILRQARRDIGRIDKGLRKENNPYIAAPLDSPQIRMRRKMEEAAALAPNRLWEAPKIEELVNNSGDGARRSRVITGNGTYCLTERSPTTNVEMIEHHGKLRITNCPQDEGTATKQTWRTLRD